jgi:GT2 family glycosyltransferase
VISSSIGIVVIGRNEGERLVRCLSSIDRSAYRVVYVDSQSTDGSIVAAEELGAVVVKLDSTRRLTAARARNEGFAELMKVQPGLAYVQFVDGDCELDRGWLDAARGFFEQRGNAAVVCGRRRERYPDASIYNRLCDIEWNTSIGEVSGCGGDSLMRVAAFTAVGGFQPQLMAGEEPELCFRLRNNGWTIWRIDHEMTRHDAAMLHFRQWWTRAVRSGYAWAEVSWLYGSSPAGAPHAYRWEILRAVFWGAMLPIVIAVGSLVHWSFVGLAGLYFVQIFRMAVQRGPMAGDSWLYASFMTISKFAELFGIVKYCWHRLPGRAVTLIEYKK